MAWFCGNCGVGQRDDPEDGRCPICASAMGAPLPGQRSPAGPIMLSLQDLVPVDGATPLPQFPQQPFAATTPLSLTNVSGMGALDCHGIPERVAGANLAAFQLTPLEGYIFTLCDGATNADDIVAAAGLSALDAARAFHRLKEHGLLRFRDQADGLACRRTLSGELRPADEEKWVPAATPHVAQVGLQRLMSVPIVQGPTETEALQAALDARDRGELHVARGFALQAWASAPDNPSAQALRQELEDPGHAPRRAASLHALAMAAHWGGNTTFAVELCRRALAEFELPQVHRQLAILLLENQARRREVQPHLERLQALAPQDEWAPRMLSWLSQHATHTPLPG